MLDACRERELRIAQIGDCGACRLTQTGGAFARAGFSTLDAADEGGLFSFDRIDSADALCDFAFETHHFFEQRFARAAGFSVDFGDGGFDRTAGGRFRLRQTLAHFFLQTAQFLHRIRRRFRRLTRCFFGDRACFSERFYGEAFAVFHFTSEEGGGGFRAARNFFGDIDLMFEALAHAVDIALGALVSVLALDRVLFSVSELAAQRFTSGAELFERFGDAVSRIGCSGFGVFNARSEAEHGAINGRDGAIETSDGELCAAFDRFNALRDARRIARADADAPIVISFSIERAEIARRARTRRRRCCSGRGRWRSAGERLAQILAKAQTLTRGSLAGGLTHFGVDALHAPALRATHTQPSPALMQRAIALPNAQPQSETRKIRESLTSLQCRSKGLAC